MSGMIWSSRFFSRSLSASFFFFMRWICSAIAADRDHRIDRGIEVRVFLLQPRKLETNFGLFLFRHVFRLRALRRGRQAAAGRVRAPSYRRAPLPHFMRVGKCYYTEFDIRRNWWQTVI